MGGFGNIGIVQILILLAIVLLVFGTKKVRNLGGDLGGAIRDFRKGIRDGEEDADAEPEPAPRRETGGPSVDAPEEKPARDAEPGEPGPR